MASLEQLFIKTKDFILATFNNRCLSSFYIGKTDNIEQRELEHKKEGYWCTIEIAYSSSYSTINMAECFLISKFKKEKDFPVKLENVNDGGGGNPNANKLYVALKFKPKDINDLDDDDLNFESMELN